jgi:hypothetical protein
LDQDAAASEELSSSRRPRKLPPEGHGEARRLQRQREETLQEIEAERRAEVQALRKDRPGRPARRVPANPPWAVDQLLDPVLRIPAPVLECGCPPDHPHTADSFTDNLPRCTVPGCPHFLETRWDGPDTMCNFTWNGQRCLITRTEHTRQKGIFHPFEPEPEPLVSQEPMTPERWTRLLTRARELFLGPSWKGLPAEDIALTFSFDDTNARVRQPESGATIEREWEITRETIAAPTDADRPWVNSQLLDVLSRQVRFINPTLDAGPLLYWDFGSILEAFDAGRIHLALRSGAAVPQFSMCGGTWRPQGAVSVLGRVIQLCTSCLDIGLRSGRLRPL